jgi:hypothetical protein
VNLLLILATLGIWLYIAMIAYYGIAQLVRNYQANREADLAEKRRHQALNRSLRSLQRQRGTSYRQRK